MKNNEIFVGSKEELNDPVYEARMWLAARNESLSRRAFIDDIAKTIYRYKGLLICRETNFLWPIPDVYETMGEDGRWLSYYFQEVDGRPKQKPSHSTLERRRLIDLRYRIKYPHRAEIFIK